MRNFRTYDVWQNAMVLVTDVYKVTSELPKYERYSLADQIQRAAVSIPSNIAEGCGRESEKEFKRFVETALASAFELETQLLISDNLYRVSQTSKYSESLLLLTTIQKQLNTLRSKLKWAIKNKKK